MRHERDEEPTLGLAAAHLARAMRERGCPLCRRVREAEERWIWTVLYELTGDPEIHRSFADSLGLCREHAPLMAKVVEERELVTPTSVARLYETVVATLLAKLSDQREKIRKEQAECSLCRVVRETEDRESWFFRKNFGRSGVLGGLRKHGWPLSSSFSFRLAKGPKPGTSEVSRGFPAPPFPASSEPSGVPKEGTVRRG